MTTNKNTQRIALAKHPGIAKRGNSFIVRTPYIPGRTSSFRLLTEALAEQAKRRVGLVTKGSAQPFAEYAPMWLDNYVGRTSKGLTLETRDDYKYAVSLAVGYFKNKQLGQIKAKDIRAYAIHLRKVRKLKASSVSKYLAPIKAMFAELTEDGELSFNPATVRIIGDGRVRKPRTLTPEQTRTLISHLPSHIVDLVWVLVFTGLRIGTAVALQWDDLQQDEEGRPILRPRHIWTPKRGIVKRRKGKAEDDESFTIVLVPALARRLMARRAAATFCEPNDYIFATSKGTAMDPHNVRNVFRAAAKEAELVATPHTLRHSLATLLYEQGWEDHQVAELLEHTDPKFTRRTYIHPRTSGDMSVLDNVLVLPE